MKFLVRHGQSEWNLARRTQGQTVHPRLTDLGRRQAVAAGEALAAVPDAAITAVVTSDLVRAVQTADTIGGILRVPVRHDVRLREQHLGDLEGLDQVQLLAAAQGIDFTDPLHAVGGGESLAQLTQRTVAAVAEYPAGTVFVSHGDAIRAVLTALDGHEPGAGDWIEVPNGAVAVLRPGRPTRWLSPTG